MIVRRILLVLFAAYLLGFVGFALTLPGPAGDTRTDAIIVPTGGPGRIDRGLELLQRHVAQRLLVTGVAPQASVAALSREYRTPVAIFTCCVDLGREAVDTRGNADEAVAWIRQHHYRTVRLVTSDWHLPRARLELTHALGDHVQVVGDAVPSNPKPVILVSEYNKLLVRFTALTLGIGE